MSNLISLNKLIDGDTTAQASYGTLWAGMSDQDLISKLISTASFTTQEANDFAANYEVIASLNDWSNGNVVNSFVDAYVFRDKVNGTIFISVDGTGNSGDSILN